MRFEKRSFIANTLICICLAFVVVAFVVDINTERRLNLFQRSGALLVAATLFYVALFFEKQIAYLRNINANSLHFSLGMTALHSERLFLAHQVGLQKALNDTKLDEKASKLIDEQLKLIGASEQASDSSLFWSNFVTILAIVGTVIGAFGDIIMQVIKYAL